MRPAVGCHTLPASGTDATAALLTQRLCRKGKRCRVARPTAHIEKIRVEIGAVEVDLRVRTSLLIHLANIEIQIRARAPEAAYARPFVGSLESKPEGVTVDGPRDVERAPGRIRIGRVGVATEIQGSESQRCVELRRLARGKSKRCKVDRADRIDADRGAQRISAGSSSRPERRSRPR